LTREVCYQIYVSNFYGKKGQRPISKDRYWAIDKKEPVVTDRHLEALRKAQEKYKREKNG